MSGAAGDNASSSGDLLLLLLGSRRLGPAACPDRLDRLACNMSTSDRELLLLLLAVRRVFVAHDMYVTTTLSIAPPSSSVWAAACTG